MGDQKNKMDQRIMAEVRRYYGDKVRQYGATPAGVDWNSEASQHTCTIIFREDPSDTRAMISVRR